LASELALQCVVYVVCVTRACQHNVGHTNDSYEASDFIFVIAGFVRSSQQCLLSNVVAQHERRCACQLAEGHHCDHVKKTGWNGPSLARCASRPSHLGHAIRAHHEPIVIARSALEKRRLSRRDVELDRHRLALVPTAPLAESESLSSARLAVPSDVDVDFFHSSCELLQRARLVHLENLVKSLWWCEWVGRVGW
jgi:hypothetical protein